jgi:hypothetical protein
MAACSPVLHPGATSTSCSSVAALKHHRLPGAAASGKGDRVAWRLLLIEQTRMADAGQAALLA